MVLMLNKRCSCVPHSLILDSFIIYIVLFVDTGWSFTRLYNTLKLSEAGNGQYHVRGQPEVPFQNTVQSLHSDKKR